MYPTGHCRWCSSKKRRHLRPPSCPSRRLGKALHQLCAQSFSRYRLKLVTVFLRYYRSVNKLRMETGQSDSARALRSCDRKEESGEAEEEMKGEGVCSLDCNDAEDLEFAGEKTVYRPPVQWSPSETDQIFVSHCEEDLELALSLMGMLESQGLSCFLPERDVPSGPVMYPMADALVACRRVVLLLTPQYLDTNLCQFVLHLSVSEMYNSQRALIVPVIYDVPEKKVPTCLRTLSQVDMRQDPNYQRKLISILKGPEISVTELMPTGNVSHGLVWAYYLRYLKIILPSLKERIDNWCTKDKCLDVHMPRKLYILVPASCHCPERIKSDDDRIQFCDRLESMRINSAGSMGRCYDLSVWNLQKNGQIFQFVAEYAAIVDVLYLMDEERNAGLDSQLRRQERNNFFTLLDNILEKKGLDLSAQLIYFHDTGGAGQKPLSDVLAPYVERDRLCSPPAAQPNHAEDRDRQDAAVSDPGCTGREGDKGTVPPVLSTSLEASRKTAGMPPCINQHPPPTFLQSTERERDSVHKQRNE